MRPLIITLAIVSSFSPALLSPAAARPAERPYEDYAENRPAPPPALPPLARAEFDSAVVHMFEQADQDGDGILTTADFPEPETPFFGAHPPFHKPPPAHANEPFLRDMIEPIHPLLLMSADMDGDGSVSLEELLSYQQTRFHQADRDEDCTISMDEARDYAFFDKMPPPPHLPPSFRGS